MCQRQNTMTKQSVFETGVDKALAIRSLEAAELDYQVISFFSHFLTDKTSQLAKENYSAASTKIAPLPMPLPYNPFRP
jgi:hypothetical protein